MKGIGEFVLNIYKIDELIQAFISQSKRNIEVIKNKKGETIGCSWFQMNHKISLILPGQLENEKEVLSDTIDGVNAASETRSRQLNEKLFVPWELHLAIYIVVEPSGKNAEKKPNDLRIAWTKALTRIIGEELMHAVGGWIPADKALAFCKETWKYDVSLRPMHETEKDVSGFHDVIETRALGTSYYEHYL